MHRKTSTAKMSKKISFFELWRTRKERGELLERANELRLRPSQLRRLLGDSSVRAALQNTRMASLLPPVGTEIFRRLTPASLEEIEQLHEATDKEKRKKNKEEAQNDPLKPASDLEEGKPLPFFYGVPPPELLSSTLEELDPFYQSQKTFIVLGKGNIIHRFNAELVCYLLSPFSPLRTFAIKSLIHSFFSLFIMVTVLTNCVFMTISEPPTWLQTVEHVFMAIYTFEVIVKVVSRGLCVGKFTFLRDPWNWLDVMVVSTGYLTVFVDLGKASVLKTVPRVLKLITVIPGLKKTVGALLQSMKGLAEVIILTVVCLSIFAMIGLQFFIGGLRSKCVMWPPNGSTEFDYNEYISSEENYYFLPGNPDALVCGNASDAGTCPEGFACLRAGRTPNYGYTSYDSFGWSLLSLVRLMSMDFWENLMKLTLRAKGKTFFTVFAVVFFPGCFCLLSLLVAVVAMVSGEREAASIAELKHREEEFGQILEALNRREEEQEVGRASLSPELDGEHQKSLEGLDQQQRSCPPCWLVFTDFLQKSKCCGRWQWLVTDPFFDLGVIVCLILNTVFMSMVHYPLTPQFQQMLSEAELVFTAIFTAEMVVKLMTMGLYGYFQVSWNIFDSILVIISLLELFISANLHWLLLMRVFRLARWWPALYMLIKVMWTSVRALRNLTLVLLIMLFLFSVAGMQLFQQDYKDLVCRISVDCVLPRWHMNDFYHSFLIIIRVLCGDWIETMWDCMEVSGQTTCLIFYMMVLIIGNLLVLNLFLALLLSSFSSLADPELKGRTNLQMAMSRITRAVRALLRKKTHINPDHKEVDSKELDRKENLTLTVVTSNQPVSKKLPEVQQHDGHEGHEGHEDTPEDCCCNKCYHCCPFLDVDMSQGMGRVWSNFRKICFSIVKHKCFEIFIIIIIVLSCAALLFEDVHLQHRQVLKLLVERADQVFTTVFLMEMVLKWFAFGLKKYFKDVWCWLDFLILQVSVVYLVVDMFGFSELGVIHSLRALLPLRMLSHIQGLKVVVVLLIRTFWSMFDMLLVFWLVWLVFSILGVNMFAGKFYYCINETSEELFSAESVNNKSECVSLIMANFTEVRWKSTTLTYNNVPSGYLTLLHVATFDSHEIMYAAVDSSLVESQLIFEYNKYMYLYFFGFIIISSFFTFNLFIRSIFDNLQGEKIRMPVLMTQEQQKQIQAMKKRVMQPQKMFPRPQNRCQAWLFDLVTKTPFELFIVMLICLYLVTLMTETDDDSEEKIEVLFWIHFTFIILFLIEFTLKVIALRRHYFTGWNILDFIMIMASIPGLFLSDLMEHYFVPPHLFFTLRVVHLFRVLLWVKGFRKLLLALMMSLPALFNIGLLLFVIMFTYSVFGMFNFAYVKKTASIDDMFNFETFGSSIICMFMVTPSGGWGSLLRPMMETLPDCDPGLENPGSEVRGNCGSPAVSIIFFVSHIVLFFLLVIHLYLAVILETLSAEGMESLSDKDLQMFYKTWRKFDPESSQFIQSSELSDFCDALQDPLKIPKPSPIKLIHKDPPLLPEDRIHFTDVLLAVATQVYGDSGNMKSLKARMEEVFMTNLSKVSCGPISSTLTAEQEDEVTTLTGQEMVIHSEDSGGVSAS